MNFIIRFDGEQFPIYMNDNLYLLSNQYQSHGHFVSNVQLN